MVDSLKTGLSSRHRIGLKAAGVFMASLGVLAAFGCSTTGSGAANSGDSQEFVMAMEYEDGGDAYDHNSVQVTDESLVGEGAVFVNGVDAENTYIYKGYAHGDNAHYSMYSLYTELITDADGLLTGINLTSGADTWANKWGYLGSNPAIVGTLPEGASFESSQSTEGSDTVITLDMAVEEGSEAAKAGHVLSEVYVYNVGADGTTVGTDTTGKGGTTHNDYDGKITVSAMTVDDDDDDEEETAASSERSGNGGGERSGADRAERSGAEGAERSGNGGGRGGQTEEAAPPENITVDAESETITIENGAYNLVQVRYRFGTEAYFDEYIAVDDSSEAEAWIAANVEDTDLSAPQEISGTGTTNRDKWTYSMLSLIASRELDSWGATFEDESLYTGGNDGEIGDIDTISGATKTSVPFQSALNQAIEAGYVTGVADEVTVTIDGGDPANGGIDVSGVHQDQTFVTTDADGNYVMTLNFPAGVDEAANGETMHAIAPTSVDIYALGDEDLGTLGVWNLGKGTAGFSPVATYADSSKAPGDVNDDHIIYVSDWDYPYTPSVTVKDPSITHVVVTYTIGHETLGIAYDLSAMAQAYKVQTMIDGLDASDSQAVAAAREAYDALSYDVKGTINNYSKLLAAEGK